MTDQRSPGYSIVLRISFLVACAASPVGLALADSSESSRSDPVTIRLRFAPGRMVRYNLKLGGQTAWTPHVRGVQWGQMATDFTFTLRTKTIRPSGACTFDLFGEALRSAGQTSHGRIDVAATRQMSKLGLQGRDSLGLASEKSPLQKPMTITLGPRGTIQLGTGLAPLVIYMLPHVDHRFWTLLTAAPIQAVAPGDRKDVNFELPVPGARGKPLSVTGTWEVLDWQKRSRRDLLPISLTAKLQVSDSNMILKNGDQIHVASGTYEASGKAYWDVDNGLLYSATADQRILLTADQPIPRALRSESRCTLNLLGVEDAKPER